MIPIELFFAPQFMLQLLTFPPSSVKVARQRRSNLLLRVESAMSLRDTVARGTSTSAGQEMWMWILSSLLLVISLRISYDIY